MMNKHKKNIMYDINNAIEYLRKIKKKRNFDESIDIVIQINNNMIKSDKIIMGTAKLNVFKKKNIIVFDNMNEELYKKYGVLIGGQDLLEKIKKTKKINDNFDVVLTTPEFMPNLTIIGSILGPKKLMPNISLGTITNDIISKIKAINSGEIFFYSDKYGNIHSSVGKISNSNEEIYNNIKILINSVKKNSYFNNNSNVIRKIYLTTTMGPSIHIINNL